MVLRITENEDKNVMIKILEQNNYAVFSELIFIPSNVESSHWKLTIFNRDDLPPVNQNPSPIIPNLYSYAEEKEYEYC